MGIGLFRGKLKIYFPGFEYLIGTVNCIRVGFVPNIGGFTNFSLETTRIASLSKRWACDFMVSGR